MLFRLGYKNSLAYYMEEKKIAPLFIGKPHVNVFLSPEDKKNFYRIKNDEKNPQRFGMGPMNAPNMMIGGMGPGMVPPMGPPPPQFAMRSPPHPNMLSQNIQQQGPPRNYPPK